MRQATMMNTTCKYWFDGYLFGLCTHIQCWPLEAGVFNCYMYCYEPFRYLCLVVILAIYHNISIGWSKYVLCSCCNIVFRSLNFTSDVVSLQRFLLLFIWVFFNGFQYSVIISLEIIFHQNIACKAEILTYVPSKHFMQSLSLNFYLLLLFSYNDIIFDSFELELLP